MEQMKSEIINCDKLLHRSMTPQALLDLLGVTPLNVTQESCPTSVSQHNVYGNNIQAENVTINITINANGECSYNERMEFINLLKEKDNLISQLLSVVCQSQNY